MGVAILNMGEAGCDKSSPDAALQRAPARASGQLFPPRTIDDQVGVPEPPLGGPRGLRCDARHWLPKPQARVSAWLREAGRAAARESATPGAA
jgi:hypothetical protein